MADERDRARLESRFVTSEGLDLAGGVAIGMGIALPLYDRYVGQKYSQVTWGLRDYFSPQPTDAIIPIAALAAVLLFRKSWQIYRSATVEARNRGLQWNGNRLVSLDSNSKRS